MSYFNEYGNPNTKLEDVGNQIGLLTDVILAQMLADGASVVDVRAAVEHLIKCVGVSSSFVILREQTRIRKENADALEHCRALARRKETNTDVSDRLDSQGRVQWCRRTK